jgi:DNA-binding transcriptional LysR family regulator
MPDNTLQQLPLLHLRPDARVHWFDWDDLFKAFGISGTVPGGGLRFDNYTLVIQAAIAAQGVAIGWRHLVDDLITQGVLERVGEACGRSERGYYLILPERKRRSDLINRFVGWMEAELSSA